jgi:hypothetical protein
MVTEQESDADYMTRKLGISSDEFEALMRVPNVPHENYPHTNEKAKNWMKSISLIPTAIRNFTR